jgi:hypothetical protein
MFMLIADSGQIVGQSPQLWVASFSANRADYGLCKIRSDLRASDFNKGSRFWYQLKLIDWS